MILGCEIFISRGPEHVRAEMQEACPTVITCVPRFLQLIEMRLLSTAAKSGPIRKALFDATVRIGRAKAAGERLQIHEKPLDWLLDRVVRRKIRAGFGGALKCLLSAGAPMSRDTILFFHALGIELHQAYGQTEAAPAITLTCGERPKPGSVGAPLHGVELRLGEDGEVLVRGPNVMNGYFQDEVDPIDAEGWLATGDIGTIDEDGDLWIVDRKRDIIKTPGGEMFAPAPIEAALQATGAIASAYVSMDEHGHAMALVTPAEAARKETVAKAVAEVNGALPAWARIRRHHAIPPITIESGMMTPTLKARRKQIFEAYLAPLKAG